MMRLSSVVENDLSAIENAHRGHLLTRKGAYLEAPPNSSSSFCGTVKS